MKNQVLTIKVNFSIGSAQRSRVRFSEGPSQRPGPIYKVCPQIEDLFIEGRTLRPPFIKR